MKEKLKAKIRDKSGVPVCPKCNKGTKRRCFHGDGINSFATPVTYDENGEMLDWGFRKRSLEKWKCLDCRGEYFSNK